MDFFNIKFSILFMRKHGKGIVNQIKNQITEESCAVINEEYIETVFKIAYMNFWGLPKLTIEKIIKDVLLNQQLNIERMQNIHKKSIDEIQRYLQSSIH